MKVAPSGINLRDNNWRPAKSAEQQGLERANKVVNFIDKNSNDLLNVVLLLIQSRTVEIFQVLLQCGWGCLELNTPFNTIGCCPIWWPSTLLNQRWTNGKNLWNDTGNFAHTKFKTSVIGPEWDFYPLNDTSTPTCERVTCSLSLT